MSIFRHSPRTRPLTWSTANNQNPGAHSLATLVEVDGKRYIYLPSST